MVSIDKTNSKPYYEQLMLSIKQDILKGILQAGDQLPSVRELAAQLQMNPNTISKAYKMLELEQVVVTVKGKGTFIKKRTLERNELRIKELKVKLREIVIEAGHLHVDQNELTEWLKEIEQSLGGM